jgi:hypothetical protein
MDSASATPIGAFICLADTRGLPGLTISTASASRLPAGRVFKSRANPAQTAGDKGATPPSWRPTARSGGQSRPGGSGMSRSCTMESWSFLEVRTPWIPFVLHECVRWETTVTLELQPSFVFDTSWSALQLFDNPTRQQPGLEEGVVSFELFTFVPVSLSLFHLRRI